MQLSQLLLALAPAQLNAFCPWAGVRPLVQLFPRFTSRGANAVCARQPRVDSFEEHEPFFASCLSGLEPLLAAELSRLPIGATDVREGRLGVHFGGGKDVGARAVLWSRCAMRVMELLHSEDEVHDQPALYDAVVRAADWVSLLPSQRSTLSVQAVLSIDRAARNGRARPGDWVCNSCGALNFQSRDECFKCDAPKAGLADKQDGAQPLTHSHFTALTVKNAVCDVVREARGWRPSVDTADPDTPLLLHVHRGRMQLYRVLSGIPSLHKRGYRADMAVHAAALKENLAAAMLLHAQYDPTMQVLCDPMCGSGTIPIEAALIATNTAPGLLRPPPPLARWRNEEYAEAWAVATAEAEGARTLAPLPILANDKHGGALALARRSAQAAGVDHCITFTQGEVADYVPEAPPQLVVSNPPWNVRLEEGEAAWFDLGGFLRVEAAGCSAFLLSGNAELTRRLRMRANGKLPIEQADASLRLIRYDVLPPRGSDAVPPAGTRTAQAPAKRGGRIAVDKPLGSPLSAALDGVREETQATGAAAAAAAAAARPTRHTPSEAGHEQAPYAGGGAARVRGKAVARKAQGGAEGTAEPGQENEVVKESFETRRRQNGRELKFVDGTSLAENELEHAFREMYK
uniref:RanBP2-type domain-containing protein n=1 Tax=Chrysotila carterae TaxID=13221 RepID=A0A7S4B9C2_CHRCT